jgi:hypothetical protein
MAFSTPPSVSMPRAYAHPPVSSTPTEKDAATEPSADARGVLKVRKHCPERESPVLVESALVV